ncbi:MAG: hypothetical protein BWY82_01425 [Verrucomicrobia bacterium ADurb.Bin474]|nr:MAG: hypothetical protein BWY82_01425 [Verrucomicrobia bacterium ADurb.Bin474]
MKGEVVVRRDVGHDISGIVRVEVPRLCLDVGEQSLNGTWATCYETWFTFVSISRFDFIAELVRKHGD